MTWPGQKKHSQITRPPRLTFGTSIHSSIHHFIWDHVPELQLQQGTPRHPFPWPCGLTLTGGIPRGFLGLFPRSPPSQNTSLGRCPSRILNRYLNHLNFLLCSVAVALFQVSPGWVRFSSYFEGRPSHPAEKIRLSCLYLWPCSLGHDPPMTISEGWNKDWPVALRSGSDQLYWDSDEHVQSNSRLQMKSNRK